MSLEQKLSINENKGILSKIKRSFVEKAAAYGLAVGLALGGIYGCSNEKEDNKEKTTFYQDADGDSYGNSKVKLSIENNIPPIGYVNDNTDCNDNNPNVHPGAPELFDGIDNNCNGKTDENSLTGKIAFYSYRDGNKEVYVMNADGSNQTNLTNNSASDYNQAFSRDGSKIAFYSNRDGNWDIYVMNNDGSNPVNLSNNPGTDFEQAWSPDNSKIIFSSYKNDLDGICDINSGTMDCNSEIYAVNLDGFGLTNLTNNTSQDRYSTWSPDGSKIAFSSHRDGNWEIYVMNNDGSGQINLTNNPSADYIPLWSPDGSKISFYSYRDGNREIYIMNADGSNQINLTNTLADDWSQTWSPDGSKIASTNSENIYIVNISNDEQTQLTFDGNYNSEPAWSPDGSKIAFSSFRNGDPEIYVTNADGGNITRLTNTNSSNMKPDWSQ